MDRCPRCRGSARRGKYTSRKPGQPAEEIEQLVCIKPRARHYGRGRGTYVKQQAASCHALCGHVEVLSRRILEGTVLEETEEARAHRVERLRREVQAGTYAPDPADVAEAILRGRPRHLRR